MMQVGFCFGQIISLASRFLCGFGSPEGVQRVVHVLLHLRHGLAANAASTLPICLFVGEINRTSR